MLHASLNTTTPSKQSHLLRPTVERQMTRQPCCGQARAHVRGSQSQPHPSTQRIILHPSFRTLRGSSQRHLFCHSKELRCHSPRSFDIRSDLPFGPRDAMSWQKHSHCARSINTRGMGDGYLTSLGPCARLSRTFRNAGPREARSTPAPVVM